MLKASIKQDQCHLDIIARHSNTRILTKHIQAQSVYYTLQTGYEQFLSVFGERAFTFV